jgi:hypothetical protein
MRDGDLVAFGDHGKPDFHAAKQDAGPATSPFA